MSIDETALTPLKQDLSEVKTRVDNLKKTSQTIHDGDVENILNFNSEYESIIKKIEDIADRLLVIDKEMSSSLWDETNSQFDDVNYIYDTTSIYINNVFAKKTLEIEDSHKKAQGLQLAVFSIVLTILAFVLTNAKILAVDEIDYKNVLLVNLSFILSADVFFSLIYIFLGPVFYSKKGGLRFFSFILLPILLLAGIVVIAVFA